MYFYWPSQILNANTWAPNVNKLLKNRVCLHSSVFPNILSSHRDMK